MKNRRSLSPPALPAVTEAGVHPLRRGGPRREVSDRVTLRPILDDVAGDDPREGWALNLSRGGVRCILEDKVELGEEYEITIGTEGSGSPLTRRCRIVWLQEEADGVVVGAEFLLTSGTHKSAPPSAPPPAGS